MTVDDYKKHLYILLLAGGGGTRLWPKSKEKTPKQFLKLFKNKTLLQVTAGRFNKILPWERIYCVTVSEEYKREILKEVPQFLADNIIVEPARRDTGPAHGIGAAFIHKKDSDAVIITEAADRIVEPISRYLKVLMTAAKVAYESHMLIATGVKTRYPHIGLGHIKRGKKWQTRGGVKFFKLDRFVEKPPLYLARRYTNSGRYYWNAGQFVWRADDILESLQKYAPEISKELKLITNSLGTGSQNTTIKTSYEAMPKIAIDYAVAEKATNFLVVEGDFFWTDIGDWKEVWENLQKDNLGNVIIDGGAEGGEVINFDTSDALIHTDGRLVAVVDVDNIVIVDTKDVLLVCSKSKAQNVKKIVELLKEKGRKELL